MEVWIKLPGKRKNAPKLTGGTLSALKKKDLILKAIEICRDVHDRPPRIARIRLAVSHVMFSTSSAHFRQIASQEASNPLATLDTRATCLIASKHVSAQSLSS
jgi:hypothetical protein